MRVLHTSDWHIGHTLYGHKRYEAHEQFLNWLLETVRTQRVDLLIVAGDVFDSTLPSYRAQTLYYTFLSNLHAATDCQHVVIVGGNHDSPTLLNAPSELLHAVNVTVVGAALDSPDKEVYLLSDRQDRPMAVVCAVPFLRERDVRYVQDDDTAADKDRKSIAGTQAHYEAAAARAEQLRAQCSQNVPVIATGHLFVTGTHAGDSERELYVGSLGQIPSSVFPAAIDYLALGHLHAAQVVGGNPRHRYCGSPLALSFSECRSTKSVCLVDFEGRQPTVSTLAVPRFEHLERVQGTQEAIFTRLDELIADNQPCLCEVIHTGDAPAVGLAQTVAQLVSGTCVDLLCTIDPQQLRAVLQRTASVREIKDLTEENVFELRLDSEQRSLTEETRAALRTRYQQILTDLRTADTNAQ